MDLFRNDIETYKKKVILKFSKLRFLDVSNKFDVYNPSRIFDFKGERYLFGRVEKRKEWANSKVRLFRKTDSGWKKISFSKIFRLEDPFVTMINDELVFGGVFVKKTSGKIEFKTVFYKGRSPFSLKKFSEGPWGMKDIRLVGLQDGKIGVFTRPLGGKYEKGKIGFIFLDSISELNVENIEKAKLIKFPFKKDEWGGVNDIIELKEGLLGVIGHLAYSEDDGRKFYYPISFKFEIKSRKISNLKLLFTRNDLPFGLPKNRFLYNVIFPGGGILDPENLHLCVGVGDSEAYEVVVRNPFN